MSEPLPGPGTDEEYLERAAALAHAGWGRVHPNPLVGCVIVRDGEIVGEGHHGEFGGPHAEVVALSAAGSRAEGATAFVSLEPCGHQGKTPPCADALASAGVRRVVYGAADPGPGRGGADRLAERGIEVVGPAWDSMRSFRENPAFHHIAQTGRPFVALKLALSVDGMIAARPGERTDITGAETRAEVHRLRSGFDAVMIGRGTLEADDPLLTVRDAPPGRKAPARVVLSADGPLSAESALYRDAPEVPLYVLVGANHGEPAGPPFVDQGATVRRVTRGPEGLDIGAVLDACAELGLTSILCEGGARLAASLLASGAVGRVYLFRSAETIGDQGLPAFDQATQALLEREYVTVDRGRRFGDDVLTVLDRTEN